MFLFRKKKKGLGGERGFVNSHIYVLFLDGKLKTFLCFLCL